jgi:O-antigen/teichoic acid export membrane protein
MERSSLTFKTLTNISYNFVGYAWPILFSILITPIIVRYLGVREYGIYIFISTILSLMTLLDMGITTAATKYLAQYHAEQQVEKMKELLHSLNSLFLGIGVTGFLIVVVLASGGKIFFPTKIDDLGYYIVLFILAGLNFLIVSASSTYNIIPSALQRFDISSKISMVYLTVLNLTNLTLVLMGFKIKALFTAQLIISIIFVFVRRYYAIKLLPILSHSFQWVSEEIKKCYRFGLTIVINNTANILLASFDRMVIPLFIGPSLLTYYSLPGNITSRIPGVSDNLSGVIFPVTASLSGGNHEEKLKRVYVRSVGLVIVISTAIAIPIIYLADKILLHWLGADFVSNSTSILIILAVTNLIISFLSPVTSFLYGIGRLKFSSSMSVVMAVINAIALLVLIKPYLITGAAWAYLISVLPIFYMIYYVEHNYVKLERRGRYYATLSLKLLLTALIFYPISLIIRPLIVNLPTLIVGGPFSVLLFLLLYRIFGFFEKDDVRDITRFSHIIFQKILSSVFTYDRNKMEDRKLQLKLFIRKFIPNPILKKIRRPQVPLSKMLEFKNEFKKNKITSLTKSNTLAVILTCYQHAEFLPKALESVLAQTRLPDELIIINDSSTDNTKNIIDEFVKNNSERFNIKSIHNEQNIGQASTINKAIEEAKTDLIMILNDDDYLLHDSVEVSISLFKENPNLSLTGGTNINFQKDESLINESKFIKDRITNDSIVNEFTIKTSDDALLYENYCDLNMTHTGSTFSREKALSVGGYFPKEKRIVKFSDRDFQIRLNLFYPVAMSSSVPFCFWRTNSSMDSGKNS